MPTLDWIGKKAVVNHHRQVPYHLLRCDPALSVGEPGSGNLLVEGDNLLALKALLPYYAGQVKCIYIDPPYNRGNEGWVYNDAVNSAEMRDWLGRIVGGEAEDLSRHDKWLCMMYPRLQLLRQFLTEDGVIFVSIDENELNNLCQAMSEILGEMNRLAILTWRQFHTVKNSAAAFSKNTEFIVAWAKNRAVVECARLRVPMDKTESYPYNDGDGKGQYKVDPIHARNKNIVYSYTFSNGQTWTAPKGNYPRYAIDTLKKMEEASEIVLDPLGVKKPMAKRYLERVQDGVPPSTLLDGLAVGFNIDATAEIGRIVGRDFVSPKPTKLIRYLLSLIPGASYLVLDCFAGTGTTGHAVLAQNRADGGTRRFIAVELDPAIAQQMTAPRLRKAVEGYEWADRQGRTHAEVGEGGGFRYCRLGAPLFDERGHVASGVTFAALAHHIFFTESGEPLPGPVDGHGPLLGVAGGVAYYLLFNGGRRNVLDAAALAVMPPHAGPRVIYADGCRLSQSERDRLSITFKQIPYQIKTT